jgi:hypothetical protein
MNSDSSAGIRLKVVQALGAASSHGKVTFGQPESTKDHGGQKAIVRADRARDVLDEDTR